MIREDARRSEGLREEGARSDVSRVEALVVGGHRVDRDVVVGPRYGVVDPYDHGDCGW